MSRSRDTADQINRVDSSAANATAITIDSSENVLVGKTSSDAGVTAGSEFQSSGLNYITRTGTPMVVNRLGSDGDVLAFRKDGTTVGRIGTESDNIFFEGGTNKTGIRVSGSGILPRDNGVDADDAVSLGQSALRFKNAYLSGGVYLGGTGAANKLDDYEEGTWTPGIRFGASTAGSLTAVGGSYTKIGRQVTVNAAFSVSNLNGGSGSAYVTGFPFAAGDTVTGTSIEGQGLVGYYSDTGESVSGMGVGVLQNGTVAEVYKYNSSTVSAAANQTTLQVGADIRFSLTYFTA